MARRLGESGPPAHSFPSLASGPLREAFHCFRPCPGTPAGPVYLSVEQQRPGVRVSAGHGAITVQG